MKPRTSITDRSARGLTLAESMIACAVVAVAASSVCGALAAASKQHGFALREMKSINEARNSMEQLVAMPLEGTGGAQSMDGALSINLNLGLLNVGLNFGSLTNVSASASVGANDIVRSLNVKLLPTSAASTVKDPATSRVRLGSVEVRQSDGSTIRLSRLLTPYQEL